MRKSLTEIANYYGTDKGTIGPSKRWNAHNYTDIYEPYFDRFRYEKINFLEIGLGVTGKKWRSDIVHGKNTGGASIKMWHDYFPKAMVYGIDINECKYLDNKRIKTLVGDQGNTESLQNCFEETGVYEFDIIIDDGSHRPDHQQNTFDFFFKKLKSGGLYIIEDLLANGKGDKLKGRMSNNNVINTRSLFKNFIKYNEFNIDNRFNDIDYISNNIESINFHSPKVGLKLIFRKSLIKPIGKIKFFKNNSERICVIRKK